MAELSGRPGAATEQRRWQHDIPPVSPFSVLLMQPAMKQTLAEMASRLLADALKSFSGDLREVPRDVRAEPAPLTHERAFVSSNFKDS